jgi:hypothetical protein
VKPDASIRIHQRNENDDSVREHLFYAEIDRSTKTHHNLTQRGGAYVDFFKTGGMAERFGAPRDHYKDFPFRVLWVFLNAERRNNAAEAFLRHRPPILRMMWLTTLAEITSNPLGAIWMRPLDYQEVTRGTRFDPLTQSPSSAYRRQIERETFVEKAITKNILLSA